mmetsp:Transcript_27350/g.63503  ORF Transcript_27350/g.63503 Transcript_27350/m.63503 type:complete len:100 (-) Transcript_27350:479-778(-)
MVRWNLFLVVLALVRAASIIVQNQNCTPDRMIIAPVGIHAGDALVIAIMTVIVLVTWSVSFGVEPNPYRVAAAMGPVVMIIVQCPQRSPDVLHLKTLIH